VPHWQLLWQVRDCVPQLPPPQSRLLVSPAQHWLVVLRLHVSQLPHWQLSRHTLRCVPQLPSPQSCQRSSPGQHWLVPLSTHVSQSPQLHVSVQTLVCVPQLPPPQSPVFVSTPGFVHAQPELTQASQVQLGRTHWCWPVHEATRVHPSDLPRMQSNPSSVLPLQSLSTASHSSVALVMVHSHPSLSSPLALPYPKSHAMVQLPPLHTGTEWSRSGQAAPQALQL